MNTIVPLGILTPFTISSLSASRNVIDTELGVREGVTRWDKSQNLPTDIM
jgi:hypothetical protein